MHTPLIYLSTITIATTAWLAFVGYSFHKTVFSYEYDFDVRDGGTPAKLKYTLFERLRLGKTIALNLAVLIIGNAMLVLFVAGLIHIIETI